MDKVELRNCNLSQVDLVVSLLEALAKLNGNLPLDLHKRFTDADVPWQVYTAYVSNFAPQDNVDLFVSR